MAQVQRPPAVPPWINVGWLLALVALVLTIVFAAIGKIPLEIAAVIVLTDLAILVP